MGKTGKKKKMGWISRFISSEKGQRFFNFAYSIGAAIVIWGALFKILHLPGGNMLLSIGMGTEVMMFLLTAFDRPPKEYKWEQVFPELGDGERKEVGEDGVHAEGGSHSGGGMHSGGSPAQGGIQEPVYIIDSPQPGGVMPVMQGGSQLADAAGQMADINTVTRQYIEQMSAITTEIERLRQTTSALNSVSEVLLNSYEAITRHSNEINDSSTGYVEEMQNLNRNISGLNTIYEIQLKSVSSQLDAIDRVNRGIKDIRDMYEKSARQSTRYAEETEKMARYMQQLNSVYEKMITAMTINMYRPMMGGEPPVAAAPAVTPDAKQEGAPEYE